MEKLKENTIAHSQGTIKLTQTLKELNKTEEGRTILNENVEKLVFAGAAITDKDVEEIKSIVGEDKVHVLRNEGDILNHLTWSSPTTKDDEGHSAHNYNFYMTENKEGELYKRPDDLKAFIKDEEGNVILDEKGEKLYNKMKVDTVKVDEKKVGTSVSSKIENIWKIITRKNK